MTEISLSTPHHEIRGYLATPQGKGPWPGVIVLHDIFGLTEVTRGHADWLAREGYLTLADVLVATNRKAEAITTLEQAVKLAPPNEQRPRQALQALKK